MTRVLYVHSRRNTFTDIDRTALAERFEVVDYFQPRLRPNPLELWRGIRSCDVVFGWFASWHTLYALTLAWLLRKPSVLVIGGFDTAAMPEIGYGSQRPGIRRPLSRWTMRRATRLITNSDYLLGEIGRNTGIDPGRVRVVHHGVPDRFEAIDPAAPRQPLVTSVGVVYGLNLERKGMGPFTAAAELVPEAEWVLAGAWQDETGERLAAAAPANLRLTGRLGDAELDDLYARTAVYVQASRHEGFGLALAEAMLAGAVPVATRAGALPEVTADVGVELGEPTPEAVAAAVRQALALGRPAGTAARERILSLFPYSKRRDGICAEVDAALRG